MDAETIKIREATQLWEQAESLGFCVWSLSIEQGTVHVSNGSVYTAADLCEIARRRARTSARFLGIGYRTA